MRSFKPEPGFSYLGLISPLLSKATMKLQNWGLIRQNKQITVLKDVNLIQLSRSSWEIDLQIAAVVFEQQDQVKGANIAHEKWSQTINSTIQLAVDQMCSNIPSSPHQLTAPPIRIPVQSSHQPAVTWASPPVSQPASQSPISLHFLFQFLPDCLCCCVLHVFLACSLGLVSALFLFDVDYCTLFFLK